MHVPSLVELEALPVQVDRSGSPGTMSMMAWDNNSTMILDWDENRSAVELRLTTWDDADREVLSAGRQNVSMVSVNALDVDHVEFVVRWGSPGDEHLLVARGVEPMTMTQSPVSGT